MICTACPPLLRLPNTVISESWHANFFGVQKFHFGTHNGHNKAAKTILLAMCGMKIFVGSLARLCLAMIHSFVCSFVHRLIRSILRSLLFVRSFDCLFFQFLRPLPPQRGPAGMGSATRVQAAAAGPSLSFFLRFGHF